MKPSKLVFAVVSLLLPFAASDWQFRSRPDLSPPRLNITVKAQSVERGYIFIAPYPAHEGEAIGPIQPGAYIFRDNCDLVWSGVGHFAGWVAHFRTAFWKNEPVLYAFQGQLDASHGRMYGNHAILNNRYETLKISKATGHKLLSAHEFQIVGEQTVLIEIPVALPVDLSSWGGDEGQRWIVSNGFQEIDIETGELIFEWYSFDHSDKIDPRYSQFSLTEGLEFSGRSSTDAWNYFHINSVDKTADGDYLISARNYAAIFKIDAKTGGIIWQLGGKHGSTFKVSEDVEFAFQHDARFLHASGDGTIETISFFDNAAHSKEKQINKFSRARIVQLNHTDSTATAVKTFPAPDGLSARSQGNTQVLPNGNVFVNWGQAGAVTEFDSKDGRVLFHAYLDSEPEGKLVESYRGFRSNWTGSPAEEAAIVALRAEEGKVSVYVSWNGDTETTSWRFFHDSEQNELLGEAKRTSFETKFIFSGYDTYRIFAEAIDSSGKALVRTNAVEVQAAVDPLWDRLDSVARKHQIPVANLEL